MKINEVVKDYVLEIEIRKYAERTVATYWDKSDVSNAFAKTKYAFMS